MRKYIFYFLILFVCQSTIAQDKKDDFDLSKVKFIYEDSVVYLNYQNRRDSLVFPIMPDASKGMQKAIRLENIIGQSVDSIKAEYESCGCGVTSFNYLVNFQNEEVISFIFMFESIGAYLTENNFFKTFNIKTGEERKLSDELTVQGLDFVLLQYKNTLISRISKELKTGKEKDRKQILSTLRNEILSLKIDDLNQNYLLTDKSLTIDLDDGIPHYARAFGIDMEVDFSAAEIRKYKSNNSKIL